jgi:YebC/PmpR family DNA-binding regulatory protein
LIKEISVAAKMGGGNQDANPRLRAAILKAKGQSLPAKNIESAIAKGIGGNSGANMEEPLYEGYGPNGCAILVQCLTDNRTRSVADVRNVFAKNGGNMGEQGSVSWSFKKKGIIIVDASACPEDKVMDLVLEAGASDMATADGVYEIETVPEAFEAVTKALENAKIEMLSAEITYAPENTVKLEGEDAQKLLKIIEKLEDNDDVQDVYHNAELPDE